LVTAEINLTHSYLKLKLPNSVVMDMAVS